MATGDRPGASQAGRASKGRSSGAAGGGLSAPRPGPISFPVAETLQQRDAGGGKESRSFLSSQRRFRSPVTLSGSLGLRAQEGIRIRGCAGKGGRVPDPLRVQTV